MSDFKICKTFGTVLCSSRFHIGGDDLLNGWQHTSEIKQRKTNVFIFSDLDLILFFIHVISDSPAFKWWSVPSVEWSHTWKQASQVAASSF